MTKRRTVISLVGSCIVLAGAIGLQTVSVSNELIVSEVNEYGLSQPSYGTALLDPSTPTAHLPSDQVINDGEVTIAWQAPAYRASGVQMEWQEISSFRIYHVSENPDEKDQVYEVPWNQTEIHVTGLSKGWHHFSISVVDQEGGESVLSESVSKQII